jgi:hypothetical protein
MARMSCSRSMGAAPVGVASHSRLSLRPAEPDSLTLCAAVRLSAAQRWRGPIKVTGQVDELISPGAETGVIWIACRGERRVVIRLYNRDDRIQAEAERIGPNRVWGNRVTVEGKVETSPEAEVILTDAFVTLWFCTLGVPPGGPGVRVARRPPPIAAP